MPPFRIASEFRPSGDQPEAIDALVQGVAAGEDRLTLLGATGTGKTYTVAHVVERVQKPTLVIAPNKSLGAQLANEFREVFPDNAVEYFVSYYDYYQPEAYVPQTDTYIEKDSSINDEIDRLRHSATNALLTRRDVIIVASVSCIYGLGSPEEYEGQLLRVHKGVPIDRDFAIGRLVDIQYERNQVSLARGKFRVQGDTLEIHPAYDERAVRIEFWGDDIERITLFDPLTGEVVADLPEITVYPASHYVASEERMTRAITSIEDELRERLRTFDAQSKLLEAERLKMRTNYDLEMMREVGFCSGIENYSRHIDGRSEGEAPYTLLDYFPDDYLVVIDESHVTVPQIGAMYEGDRSRKDTLVDFGFRLPSARDNRPLTFDEFTGRVNQVVFLSATPGSYELRTSKRVVEQIVRPTGLVDPEVQIRPTRGQVDDLIEQIRARAESDQRVLVTTLTKKMAEDLTDYLLEMGIRVRYLHSEIDTLQRIEILRDLRLGEFDVLVGINLLREGLDLPEVSLVAILDADKEGFLRSETSLIQTIGRAARNVDGTVIMYADEVTDSMKRAISETQRRRQIQLAYNREHDIDPQTIRRKVSDILLGMQADVRSGKRAPIPERTGRRATAGTSELPRDELTRLIQSLEDEMHEAAKDLRFEYAARLRDEVNDLRKELKALQDAGVR
ncbi:MAG: excinuclease ABC subunit UvrB [Actinomycetota bacterium]